jgi:ankyrin repeat protein
VNDAQSDADGNPTARSLPSPERIQQLLFDAAAIGREDMIAPLLVAGADIEARDARGYTALILATYNDREGAARLLLGHGAAIDAGDDARGNTALHGVAFKGYVPIAQMLIDAGADVNRRNRSGQTALMLATLFGRADMFDLLVGAGADPDAIDEAGNSAMSVAVSQANVEMQRIIADAPRGR